MQIGGVIMENVTLVCRCGAAAVVVVEQHRVAATLAAGYRCPGCGGVPTVTLHGLRDDKIAADRDVLLYGSGTYRYGGDPTP